MMLNEPAVRMTIKPVCSRALYEVSAENGRSQMLFLLVIKLLLLISLSFLTSTKFHSICFVTEVYIICTTGLTKFFCHALYSEKAPSLKQFGGTHLEADQYHEAMKDPEAVIIDVRNAYESAIGHFKPPESGAKLIDPNMRNSIEFPKWLNSQETKKKLAGKKVLMYCTGGIRCERATALLNQMSAVGDDLNLKGVYHCRGGIERYVKTYAEGGYW